MINYNIINKMKLDIETEKIFNSFDPLINGDSK